MAPDVLGFRQALDAALNRRRPGDPPWAPAISDARWGVYAFYDYEQEPIYVGQTNERLRVRVRRHLTNQRTDAVGMRVLDPYEVESIELWPLPRFDAEPAGDTDKARAPSWPGAAAGSTAWSGPSTSALSAAPASASS